MTMSLRWFRKVAAIEQLMPYRQALQLRIGMQRLFGILEPETKLLPAVVSPGDHVIDVGANAGVYTYLLSRLGCQVESFEPLTYYSKLLESAELRNVDVHNVALSDSEGEGTIHVPVIDGLQRRARASIQGTSDAAISQAVTFAPLDIYGFSDVRFMKIDVEGHEMAVLRGAKGTIQKSNPVVLIEIEEHRLAGMRIEDFFSWFYGLGYKGYFYRGRSLQSIESFDVKRDQAVVDRNYKHATFINNFLFMPFGKETALPERL